MALTPQERALGRVIATLGLAVALGATLTPTRGGSPLPNLCIVCGERGSIDAVLNVLLFVPFGFGLRLAGVSLRRVALVALGVTVGIELLQVTAVRGRDASLGDIVWNTTGATLGALAAGWWRTLLRPRPAAAAALARAMAACVVAIVLLTGWMLAPSFPESTYFAQWRPPETQQRPIETRVLDARWNGVPFPNGRAADSRVLREKSEREGVHVDALLEPVVRGQWILRVLAAADERRRVVWYVGTGRGVLRWWTRSRADALLFRSPGIVVPFAGAPGDTVRVRLHRVGSRHDLEITANGRTSRTAYAMPPTHGLALIAPRDLAPHEGVDVAVWIWLAMLFAPLGYWCGAAAVERARRVESFALPPAAVAVALGLGALATGTAVPPADQWVAALASAAVALPIGAAVSRRFPRTEDR